MALHYVNIGLVHLNGAGQVINKNTATLGSIKNFSTEFRVIPKLIGAGASNNSANYPTVAEYLESESNDGFALSYMDQSIIVTQEPLTGSGGNSALFFSVSRTTNQTFTNVGESVSWGTEVADQTGYVDISTYPTRVITTPVSGLINVVATFQWTVNSTDTVRGVIIRRFNSSNVQQEQWTTMAYMATSVNGSTSLQQTTTIMRMSAGDYVTVVGFIPDTDGTPSLAAQYMACVGTFIPD